MVCAESIALVRRIPDLGFFLEKIFSNEIFCFNRPVIGSQVELMIDLSATKIRPINSENDIPYLDYGDES